jgi:hypothetical protein
VSWSIRSSRRIEMFPVGAAVRVIAAINYGGGTSTLNGKIGVVKRRLSARAAGVALEDQPKDILWFFDRELALLEDGC